MIRLLLCLVFILAAPLSHAETFKLATIVPDDAAWTINLKKFAKEVREKTAGRVEFKLYAGGVAGDEPDILRKIRVGQLHGGILTGTAMGSVYSDIRIMEVPFNFIDDRSLALKVLKDMEPYFTAGFAGKGFRILGLYEQGKVYVISKEKIGGLGEMKKTKFWAWEGDELVAAMLKALDLVPINLGLTDVLPSLSTGLVETVYGPPLGIIALQWNTRVKYLVNFPVTYGFGSLLIAQSAYFKISKEDRKIVDELAAKCVHDTNDEVVKGNDEALQSMKQLGLTFVELPASDLALARKVRGDVIKNLTGKMFSQKTVDLFEKSIGGKK